MNPIFPVKQAKEFLVTSVRNAVERDLPDLRDVADLIVDLHLDPKNFAINQYVNTEGLRSALIRRSGANELREFITFEDTHSIQGICRVMARTHLNRIGVGFVSRGETDKTQAKRVLGLFPYNRNPHDLVGWQALISAWVEFAEKSINDNSSFSNESSRFNCEDLISLKNLSKLPPEKIYDAKNHPGIHNNWAKVVVGVHTGLEYLSRYYGLDANRLWKKIDEASMSIQGVKNLTEEAAREITEYGQALAGNFFADLGGERFVKVDVHVRDSITAFLKKKVSDDVAFEIIQRTSEVHGITPRAVDKIMYLACSSNLYLIGYRPPPDVQQKQKERFLNFLRSL
jgi:hypothetical protein